MLNDDAILDACRDPEFVARFEAKINRTGACHIWIAGATRGGYGLTRLPHRGPQVLATRVAWILARGAIPAGTGYHGTCVLHNCPEGDNPSCVNVDHLFLGTQSENVADAISKGRFTQRRHGGTPRLSEAEVREILRRAAAGEKHAAIAADFCVTRRQVSRIASGENWIHLK